MSEFSMDARAQECVRDLIEAHSGFKKSFISLMLAMFNVYELKKEIENKREEFPGLFEKTKSAAGLHSFLKSLDDGFDMQYQSFRAYFSAVSGLVAKYGEHYDSFEELIQHCEITTLTMARSMAKSAKQVAYEKLAEENKKLFEAKKEELLKREYGELMGKRKKGEAAEEEAAEEEAAEEEAAERPKRAKLLLKDVTTDSENEEGDEEALVLTNILSRGESVSSTSSIDLKIRNLAVRSSFDDATIQDKDFTIKFLKKKIRVLKEQVAQMTIQLGDAACAIANDVAETFPGDTQGDSQWDL